MAPRQAQEIPEEGAALSPPPPDRLTPLRRSFYARPSIVVARDLLGRLLVREGPEGRLVGRIVECEAYADGDPASHSFHGLTARTAVMFGPPGHLYVYFTYGMHFCMNVVTGREGEGSAVLLRAVEPLQGLEAMIERRGLEPPGALDPRLLCAGPARLTQAFGVTKADNGLDLASAGDLFVARGRRLPERRVAVGPRVGIRVAVDRPWRFVEAGSPFVSRTGRPARSDGGGGRW